MVENLVIVSGIHSNDITSARVSFTIPEGTSTINNDTYPSSLLLDMNVTVEVDGSLTFYINSHWSQWETQIKNFAFRSSSGSGLIHVNGTYNSSNNDGEMVIVFKRFDDNYWWIASHDEGDNILSFTSDEEGLFSIVTKEEYLEYYMIMYAPYYIVSFSALMLVLIFIIVLMKKKNEKITLKRMDDRMREI